MPPAFVPSVRRGSDWADLVFHVLAHVAGTASLPSSLSDPCYVAWAERALGPAGTRPLGEDAPVLGRLLARHDECAAVQLLAWLHPSHAEAARLSGRDLAELASLAGEAGVDTTAAAWLAALGPAAELVRCAALLEHESYARLPAIGCDPATVARELERLLPAAPWLPRYELAMLPALRLRGRLRGRQISIGLPSPELALAPAHVAWQAAHEATVGEVAGAAAGRLGERAIEAVALPLSAVRAARAGLRDEHAAWLAHLQLTPEQAGELGHLTDAQVALWRTLGGG